MARPEVNGGNKNRKISFPTSQVRRRMSCLVISLAIFLSVHSYHGCQALSAFFYIVHSLSSQLQTLLKFFRKIFSSNDNKTLTLRDLV